MTDSTLSKWARYTALALVAAWAGVRVYSSHHVVSQRASAVAVGVGEASPPSETDLVAVTQQIGPLSAKIPDKIPDFSLVDLQGKLTSIRTWQGKSMVLNFWATWCAPCRREIPLLKSLRTEWAHKGTEVIGVAVDHRDKVSAYAAELKIPYPLLVGEQDALDAAATLGMTDPVFPFTVFIDRRGDLVALYIGELHKPQVDLILAVVETLDRDANTLTEARRAIAEGLRTLGPDRAT